MGNLERIIGRLDKVKEIGPGRYMACCPAHDDRIPSLLVTEKEHDRVIIHCFAGCHYAGVLSAIGLEPGDTYPKTDRNYKPLKPGEIWVPRDVVAALRDESLFVVVAASALAAGKVLTEEDNKLLIQEAKRFHAAAVECGYD